MGYNYNYVVLPFFNSLLTKGRDLHPQSHFLQKADGSNKLKARNHKSEALDSYKDLPGSFRKLGVPYLGVLIVRMLLFRVRC